MRRSRLPLVTAKRLRAPTERASSALSSVTVAPAPTALRSADEPPLLYSDCVTSRPTRCAAFVTPMNTRATIASASTSRCRAAASGAAFFLRARRAARIRPSGRRLSLRAKRTRCRWCTRRVRRPWRSPIESPKKIFIHDKSSGITPPDLRGEESATVCRQSCAPARAGRRCTRAPPARERPTLVTSTNRRESGWRAARSGRVCDARVHMGGGSA